MANFDPKPSSGRVPGRNSSFLSLFRSRFLSTAPLAGLAISAVPLREGRVINILATLGGGRLEFFTPTLRCRRAACSRAQRRRAQTLRSPPNLELPQLRLL